jgi:putative methyltransferase (TIGR04325 family)
LYALKTMKINYNKIILLKIVKLFKLFKKKYAIRLTKKNVWSGNFDCWKSALEKTNGYSDEYILEKCKKSIEFVKQNSNYYERDSVLFEKKQYNWGIISTLLQVALENKNTLKVLDFGGSLGSSYYQNLSYIEKVDTVQWCVIEQENFVKCGRENFEDDKLKFYYTIEECMEYNKPNVVLLSSVLQYLEKPHELIEKVLSLDIDNIIIDRTAFIECERDIITIQNVPEGIYKASYPAWFFNKENFLAHFKHCSEVIEFDSGITHPRIVNGNKAYWSGFIIKK